MKTINKKLMIVDCKEQKPAGQALIDFEKMMERLKPYLPKLPEIKPEPKRYWQIPEPITYP